MSFSNRRPDSPNDPVAEALESCRPGSRDIHGPHLEFLKSEVAKNPQIAATYERLQRLDAKIADAFQNVPIPEGLADRVLNSLTQAQPRPEISRQKVQQKISRRLLLGAGASTVAAGLLTAATLSWMRRKPVSVLSEQCVLDEAIHYFEHVPQSPSHLLAEVTPPAKYPFSQSVVMTHGAKWSTVSDFLGAEGVVYDLLGTNDGQAMLYVLANVVACTATAPSLQPFTTAGCSASMWKENGLLNVLVVHGDPSIYQRHLRLPSGTFA
jgi:hypothetical protein